MKRNSITFAASALALALATPCAYAQTSVNIYGVLDVGILSETNVSNPALGYLPSASDKGRLLEMKDGGLGESYWGIKGSEDLGSGLHANFNLQGNFLANNGVGGGPDGSGASSLFNQQANLGLSGNFGSVQAGRVVSPVYYAIASTDVRSAAYFGSVLTGLVALNSATGAFTGASSNTVIGTVYNDNAIIYSSPTVGGFTGNFEYSMGGVAGNTSALRQEAASLTYNGGGLRLAALYYNGNDDGIRASVDPSGVNTNRLVSLSGLYTLQDVSVSAGYFKGSNPSHPGAGINPATLGGAATSGDADLYSFGLGYRVSPQIKLTSGVYHVRDNANPGNKSTLYSLGLDYYLSKESELYLETAGVNNRGSNMNQSPAWATPVTAGVNSTAWMAGVRHMF